MQEKQTMPDFDKIKLKSPLLLAPIAGYTDSPFRKICIKHGCGLTMTELISAEGIIRKNKKTMELLSFTDEERPLAIQIFGRKPDVMGEAASVVESFKPDIIDINMGCPARKVCGSGNGAYLLTDPDLIFRITESVVKSTSIPVTAKIRTGWDDNSLNYMEVVKALEAAGVTFIAVHGRTRAQQYSGFADWNIIREICSGTKVPVIGNGDIDSYEKAYEMMKFSGCRAVMIGRGAIGNPWIFSGKNPGIPEIIQQVKEHLDMMFEEYGNRGINMMRKHIVKYISGIKNAAKARSLIVQAEDKNEIFKILDTLEQTI
jgi:tRNA-dihydrouridine synthase B